MAETTAPPRARVPWTAPTAAAPVEATLRLPGSKSMTARALVLSALSGGSSTLRAPAARPRHRADGAGPAPDGQPRLDRRRQPVGRALPAAHRSGPRRRRPGRDGHAVPAAGRQPRRRRRSPSTATRTRGCGPMAPLIAALQALGVRIEAAPGGGLPLTVHGAGRVTGGEVTIDASASSQLVSGLLLSAPDVRPRRRGPPRRAAGAQRAAPANDRPDAPRGRGRRRRQRQGRVAGRAGPAVRARLGHRARPVRRRAVPGRRAGHRRHGHRARLAAQHHPAG